MSSQLKNIILAIVLIILAFGVYSYFKRGAAETSGSLLINAQTDIDVLGQDITKVLNRIDNIDLDRNVFSDPVYNALQDRSQTISSQPVGRDNIFLPYQRTVSPSGTSTSSETTTTGN